MARITRMDSMAPPPKLTWTWSGPGPWLPGATIDLVIAGDTSMEEGLYLAAERAVYSNIAPVISISFGAMRILAGRCTIPCGTGLWEQAAAQGITVMVSTGDSGSAGCDNPDTETVATARPGGERICLNPVQRGGRRHRFSLRQRGCARHLLEQHQRQQERLAENPYPGAGLE